MLDREKLSADFCVLGGGMAGICAALAAARCGVRTILIHDRPVLGGNASSECRVHITGANQHGGRPDARETGIVEELMLTNLALNPQQSYSVWDTILWEALRYQSNLRVLYNCSCFEARRDGDRIASVTGWQLTTQMAITVEAQYFADCTGDAITTPIAGAECRRGREGRQEFDESLAPQKADNHTMGMTCLFGARRTNRPQPFSAPIWAYRFKSIEDLAPNRRPHGPGFGYWWVELGGDRDSIADTEDVRDELLRVVYGLWDLVKNRMDCDAECWAMDWVQFLPAKRESRRLVGDYLLCQGDIESGGRFPDTVAYGGWSMDQHPPAGFWSPEPPADFGKVPDVYGIPLRSLYSANIANLWMAGRNASCTHVGLSSTRVMGTGSVMGQAVGTAVAYALRHGHSPRECADGSAIGTIQQKLLANDCYLPGVPRKFGEATAAAVLSASAGSPEPLRDGVNRQVHEVDHSWRCAPGGWVECRWPQPHALRSLTLAFDTDLTREICMSYFMANSRTETPAELVKGFDVEAEVDGRWVTVHHEDDNRQRLRTVRFEDLKATALRLTPLSTHGAPEARVFTMAVNEPAATEFER
jgi:hypothetical protein